MRSPKAAPDAARAPRLDRPSFGQRLLADIRKNWILYVMVLPVLAYYLLFSYVPMAGIQLAFKKYMIKKGIWGSPWVGLKNFSRFFKGYNFWTLIWNTMAISLYSLVVGTVVPILFSVLINYVRHKRWKKTLQMVTYLPYFISNVVLVGMLAIFLGDSGLINALLQRLGLEAIPFCPPASSSGVSTPGAAYGRASATAPSFTSPRFPAWIRRSTRRPSWTALPSGAASGTSIWPSFGRRFSFCSS